jgi:hypothetical protein
MDLDTLIYIIVMIVFIALGAFGKKKKPGQQPVMQEDAEDEGFTAPEDIIAKKLKEFLGGYEEEKSYSEPENVIYEQPSVQEMPPSVLETYQPAMSRLNYIPEKEEVIDQIITRGGIIEEGMAAFEHFDIDTDGALSDGDLTMQNDPHDGIKPDDLFAEFKGGFDVRKAIIYSEIINRKQF